MSEEMNEIVDDTRISFFVCGAFPNGRVYIQRLNEQKVWECRDFEAQATLHYLLSKAECRDENGNFYPGMEDEPARLLGIVTLRNRRATRFKLITHFSRIFKAKRLHRRLTPRCSKQPRRELCMHRDKIQNREILEFFIEGVNFFEANLGKMHGATEGICEGGTNSDDL